MKLLASGFGIDNMRMLKEANYMSMLIDPRPGHGLGGGSSRRRFLVKKRTHGVDIGSSVFLKANRILHSHGEEHNLLVDHAQSHQNDATSIWAGRRAFGNETI